MQEWTMDHNAEARHRTPTFGGRLRAAARASVLCCVLLSVAAGASPAAAPFEVPAWLFPVAALGTAPGPTGIAPDDSRLLRVPGSDVGYTRAQLRDFFAVPDWHADAQPPVPQVVAQGRRPDVYACGYCHLPDGAGRPENATVAGLPAEYIVQQVKAFATGHRQAAWTGQPFLPATLMARLAGLVSDRELADAATYYSSLALRKPRALVVEVDRVPRTRAIAYVYQTIDGGGDELLGNRIIEVPRDFERHELRDARLEYVAYVPPGSVERGRHLALAGTEGVPSCATCHGPDLRGVALVPPIAGRSPTYLMRQLVAFRTRARQAPAGLPMQPVVDGLDLRDMIAAAAYAGSLPP
jgi:cytochrome c553